MSSASSTAAAKPVSFTSKQIQQMVSFICQEAEERANEISVSVDVTAVPFCFFAVRKKSGLAKGIKSAIPRVQTNNVPTRWSLAEIKSATMGFYKSRIIDKVLQGWCCEESELVLVYEYLSNGSLYQHIHKTSVSSTTTLSWSLRLKIIHRDVKTCNIMLDDEFNAKLGDFGLVEVFGVVVLEVATGKRPVDENGTVLVDWLGPVQCFRDGKIVCENTLDARLDVAFNKKLPEIHKWLFLVRLVLEG
ncbi:probable L-type lectin-domain containing receptor kinase S.7 [Hibiscus syriacus]|uniref:probable L-type lectin-domain containing receptor kinase S.7 n=1 Tax=Hibiscus syriacus TaxID=106335 RepID=UPI0019237888|nr:probable L-type lectin-domain containing receptor kinase S.7 [Hibiscus syriacus]